MNEATITSTPPLLVCKQLSKRYGTFTALAPTDLIIPKGRIVGLLGPNGSGKTTLIKLINGLITKSSGEIQIEGHPVGVKSKQLISYLPDRTYLNMSNTVSSVLDMFQDFYKDFDRERAILMLDSLGISQKTRLKTMSKGTKEKVQLILVMSRNAKLYILDEPIAGVDPAARDYILRTIIQNYNPEASIIIATHLIADIEQVLDDVIFLQNGNVMLYNSVENIRMQYEKSVDEYFREVFRC